jgi:hypothetical protein
MSLHMVFARWKKRYPFRSVSRELQGMADNPEKNIRDLKKSRRRQILKREAE